MACRCRDMNNCRSDIATLQSIIYKLERAENAHYDLHNQQNQIQIMEQEAYELKDQKRTEIQQKLKKTMDESGKQLENSKIIVRQKVQNLERELRSMEREDEAHHSSDED